MSVQLPLSNYRVALNPHPVSILVGAGTLGSDWIFKGPIYSLWDATLNRDVYIGALHLARYKTRWPKRVPLYPPFTPSSLSWT